MKTLENWIQNLTEKPINFKGINDVESHLEKKLRKLSLSKNGGFAVQGARVNKRILRQLQLKIREHKHEDAIWTNVLWYLSRPLPSKLAHDLIDRGIAISMMSHTRQKDGVQWRLATIHRDALYTLVRERYTESQFSVEQFYTMLEIYPWLDDGLLAMLLSFRTDSAEKETVLVAAIERELKYFSEMKKQDYKRSGAAYFKQRLANREDIIEQLGKKYRRLI